MILLDKDEPAIYLLTYDLRDKADRTEDYEKLEEIIQSFESAKIAQSVWAVKAALTLDELYEQLNADLCKDDTLFITPYCGNHRAQCTIADINELVIIEIEDEN